MWIPMLLLCHPLGWLILACIFVFAWATSGNGDGDEVAEQVKCGFPEFFTKTERDRKAGKLPDIWGAIRCLWVPMERMESEAREERLALEDKERGLHGY